MQIEDDTLDDAKKQELLEKLAAIMKEDGYLAENAKEACPVVELQFLSCVCLSRSPYRSLFHVTSNQFPTLPL